MTGESAVPAAGPEAEERPVPAVYRGGRHVRAALALLLASVLLLGVAYPLALVGFGELVNPHGANGSLTHNPNGSVNNSSLLPPGTSSTVGGVRPVAAGHPALRALPALPSRPPGRYTYPSAPPGAVVRECPTAVAGPIAGPVPAGGR